MRKSLVAILGIVALAAIAWASGDPWKDKPYQQWDSKDVQKILDDSPWSHIVRVDANWKGGGGSTTNANSDANTPIGGTMAPSGAMASRPMSNGGGPANSTVTNAPDAGQQTGPTAAFVVRWASARVLREALVRSAVLGGEKEPPDADAQLAKPTEDYQVLIAGPDMTPFSSLDQNTLKSSASLVLKHTKEKLSPTSVTVQKDPTDRKISYILFSFPKNSQNGEPVIGTGEKTVEFNLDASKLSIKTTFDIPKMVDSQGIDL